MVPYKGSTDRPADLTRIYPALHFKKIQITPATGCRHPLSLAALDESDEVCRLHDHYYCKCDSIYTQKGMSPPSSVLIATRSLSSGIRKARFMIFMLFFARRGWRVSIRRKDGAPFLQTCPTSKTPQEYFAKLDKDYTLCIHEADQEMIGRFDRLHAEGA